MSVIYKVIASPPYNYNEILRYSHSAGGELEKYKAVIDECIFEIEPKIKYGYVYSVLDVDFVNEAFDFPFGNFCSRDLSRLLCKCEKAILVCVTAGFASQILSERYSYISPLKSLFFDSIGSERAEAICDSAVMDIMVENDIKLTPRFSPGYGDLPLRIQPEILEYLEAKKYLGVTIDKSNLMNPVKTVTAFAGVLKKIT